MDAYHFYEDEWNDYGELRDGFEWEVPERFNMAHYVCDRWASDDGRVALFAEDGDRERTVTFSDLADRTNQLANHLRERGVEPGDCVGVNAPQKPETVVAHLAAWKLGAVSVPLSTLFGVDGLSYRLDDSDAVACVVDESNADTLRSVRDDLDDLHTVLTVDVDDPGEGETDLWAAIEGLERDFDVADTHAEDDAIIIYTSGTTGDPKGVRHAHRVLLGHLPLFLTSFCNLDLREDDVAWTPSEWAWVASLFDIVFPALYYGRPVVASAGGPFDPTDAFETIDRYDVSILFAPPTALRMMMRVEDPTSTHDTDSVRVIASGGESLGQSIVDWGEDVFAGAAVHEAYGQTEANLLIGDCTALTEFREGTMGLAAPGHDVRIVDTESAEPTVDPGDTGEIAVRYDGDPVCFKSYLNKPEKTAGKVRNGWLLTEDLGVMDEDGYVAFVSRTDDVIISAGYRIGPEEIEESLAGHDAVANAAVIGVPDDERGEVPKAFVVLADGYEPSDERREELKSHVKERLAKYEYPRAVEFIEELPKTTTGKVRRADLR
ncbi:acyl-CoA synthetase [Salarchaeum sp. III]|uniref:acyl-CoA synthetase n=1 Tax=Salarchaeum sp. III TaxID=3107927 RepID=UPI003FA75403